MTKPIVHSFENRIIAIIDVKNSIFSFEMNRILGVVFSGGYGFSIAIFGINFFHRYGSLDKVNKPSGLANHSLCFWCVIPVFCCFAWGFTMYSLFMEDEDFTETIRFEVLDQYDLRMEDIIYLGPYVFKIDKNGEKLIEWKAVLGVLVFVTIVTTFSYIVLYFGYKCYSLIQNSFDTYDSSTRQSNLTQNIQRELFQALVIQTLIPFVLLYIPASIILICFIFLINTGTAGGTLCITIALYPVIDALPTLLIVRHYRKTVNGMICNIVKKDAGLKVFTVKTISVNIRNTPL